MTQFSKTLIISLITLLSFSNFASAETTMSAEGQYIFNSLGFYLGGVLVAFMAAGFCMLESGLVTTKSVSTIAIVDTLFVVTNPLSSIQKPAAIKATNTPPK